MNKTLTILTMLTSPVLYVVILITIMIWLIEIMTLPFLYFTGTRSGYVAKKRRLFRNMRLGMNYKNSIKL